MGFKTITQFGLIKERWLILDLLSVQNNWHRVHTRQTESQSKCREQTKKSLLYETSMQKASQRNSHLHLHWSKHEGHWSLGVTMIGVTWHFPSNMHNFSHILLLQILKASWRKHKQYFHTWLPVSHANWKRETMKYLFWKKKTCGGTEINLWNVWKCITGKTTLTFLYWMYLMPMRFSLTLLCSFCG